MVEHLAAAGNVLAVWTPTEIVLHVVLDPSSDPTRVLFRGPPAAAVRALGFDGRHVAWATDGCQLVADVGSPALRVIPAGPCVRTEASFTQHVRGRARIVHIPVSPRDDIFYTAGRVIDPDGRRRIAITF